MSTWSSLFHGVGTLTESNSEFPDQKFCTYGYCVWFFGTYVLLSVRVRFFVENTKVHGLKSVYSKMGNVFLSFALYVTI